MKILNKAKEHIIKQFYAHSKMNMHGLKPEKFEFNLKDLSKMHHLRRWYITNTKDIQLGYKYTQELEQLHNDLNYLSLLRVLRNLVIFFVSFLTYRTYFANRGGDNFDFQNQYSLTHQKKIYGNLTQGGLEDSLNV